MLPQWYEILLVFFGAFGMLSLGWLLFSRLLAPNSHGTRTYAVVPASGDGVGLEQAVKGLLWMRGGTIQRYTVVIADAGLSPVGLSIATALANGQTKVVLCPVEMLTEYLL